MATHVDNNGEPVSVTSLSDLIARYGSSSSTVWLELERYSIWRPSPSTPIAESTFPPIQGYMRHDPYVFAWGNPVVSDPAALEPTAAAFVAWVQSQELRPIWVCVDHDFEGILGGDRFKWSTVSCIHEDVVDPAHIMDITKGDTNSKPSGVKDLNKNLRRAERSGVVVEEVNVDSLGEEDKKMMEDGVEKWKKTKLGSLSSSSLHLWLDQKYRRYWLARQNNQIVGLLILTHIKDSSYQIKHAISFPGAPKGTSEELLYTTLKDIHKSEPEEVTVTFGVSASDELEPVENLSGWKITWLSKAYSQIARTNKLVQRSDFRSKFDATHDPLYVCYPEDGFGFEAVSALLKLLHK